MSKSEKNDNKNMTTNSTECFFLVSFIQIQMLTTALLMKATRSTIYTSQIDSCAFFVLELAYAT